MVVIAGIASTAPACGEPGVDATATAETTTVPPSVTAVVTTAGTPSADPAVLSDPMLTLHTERKLDGPMGNGCEPPAGPLADGIWLGEINATPTEAVNFNVVCEYTGEAFDATGLSIDEYPQGIVDLDPTTVNIPIGMDARWWALDPNAFGLDVAGAGECLQPQAPEIYLCRVDSFAELTAARVGGPVPVALLVEGGVVVEAAERFRS